MTAPHKPRLGDRRQIEKASICALCDGAGYHKVHCTLHGVQVQRPAGGPL